MFEGAQKRLSIVIASNRKDYASQKHFTSSYFRWMHNEFVYLFTARLFYEENTIPYSIFDASLGKIGSAKELIIFKKILNTKRSLGYYLSNYSQNLVYYTRKFNYFLSFLDKIPIVHEIETKKLVTPSELKELSFPNIQLKYGAISVLSSSTFFWFWNVLSDCRNINRRDLLAFPITDRILLEVSKKGEKYLESLNKSSYYMKKSGLELETFDYSGSKNILNEIDELLAKHYGFTEEELDFIINYDIKYRMGDKLNDIE